MRDSMVTGNNKGAALIIVFFVITVLLIFSTAFIGVSVNQNLNGEIFRRREAAFYLAEAGLDRSVVWLRSQASPPSGNYTNPWGGATTIGAGTYNATITDLGIVNGTGTVRRYKITSTGSYGNKQRTLTNFIQVDNYARYLWFTNREVYDGSTVWFWSQDHLDGPTHTNGHFNIYGTPVFESEVRSVDDYIRFNNNGNNINLQATTNPPYDEPDFQQGVMFGAEATTMPSQALNLRAAASSGGISLRGNTTVVLCGNGTMTVTNALSGWTNKNMALPANGAFFVTCGGRNCASGGSLTVSGTLNGRLTVGAERDIRIPNNITYADNPRTNSTSDDTMGIISERDVVIDDGGPTNLEIDASIMALETSFMLENYWSAAAKGNLTVYGGIIQDERGPVGTFNTYTGKKVSGYSKVYEYDGRLLSAPPPYMPTTGDYVTLSWDEN